MILSQLPINKKTKIKILHMPDFLVERLHRMGIIEGIEIETVGSTPLDSPRIYKVLNTCIAIRKEIADKIITEDTCE